MRWRTAATRAARPRSGKPMSQTTASACARSCVRLSGSLTQIRVDELLQLRVLRAGRLQPVAPGERLNPADPRPLVEDHGLAGGGQVGVEVVLLEVRGRVALVGDHDVAELQRLEQLVVTQLGPVGLDRLRAVVAAG